MPNTNGELNQVLARLARSTSIADGNLQQVLEEVAETAALALGVERVNIWLMDDAHTQIRCMEAYSRGKRCHTAGEVFEARDYPAYFAALEQLRTIATLAVQDAPHDPKAREMAQYMTAHGITTMLDAPIHLSGRVAGVVCHEHLASPRNWTTEEKAFAGSIADFVSLSLEADRRVRAERGLRESEAFLRLVAAQIPDQLFLVEVETEGGAVEIRSANLAACQAHGYREEELTGRPFAQMEDPVSAAKLPQRVRQMLQGEPIVFEALHRRKDGTPFTVEIAGRAVRFGQRATLALLGRDITVRKEAERQNLEEQAKRLESRRLESLGGLAGDMAHDFQGLLDDLRQHVGQARQELPTESPVLACLDQAERALARGSELCQQLQRYAGQRHPNHSPAAPAGPPLPKERA